MNKISAIIIAKNEENMIVDCLESVSFCDEIVFVDTGSTDRTVQIAKKMGVKVFSIKSNDFSQMRNFGLEKAKEDWVFYIDADERVTAELATNIKKITEKENQTAAYKIKRKNFYFGNHEWPHRDRLERLFQKQALKKWYGALHESPVVEGQIEELDGYLLHYSHRDLASMVAKTIAWSKIEAELRLKANHPRMVLWRFPRMMITAFYDSYIKQGGWKVGTVGLIESMYQAFSMFITYGRLWETQRRRKTNGI